MVNFYLFFPEKYQKKNCFIIGPPKDHHLVDGLDLKIVNKDSHVDFILNTGPWGDNDCLENYTELLDHLVKNLPSESQTRYLSFALL